VRGAAMEPDLDELFIGRGCRVSNDDFGAH
jgi:hypothetical protein